MKINRISPGNYETADGKYKIGYVDDYETECEEPHPVRISLETVNAYSPHYRDSLLRRGKIKGNNLTYFCEGGEPHFYAQWIVWDNAADDYAANSGPSGFDTLRDAKELVQSLYS